MGTTVTTNLGLIKPDDDEKIKEDLPTFAGWATQNESNTEVIDDLFRHTDHTWSPAWTTDIASNPVLGAGGFVEGKYLRIFPRMVVGYIRVYAGAAGFNPGSGLYRLSVPCTVPPEFAAYNAAIPVGRAYLHDNSTVASSTNLGVLYDVANNVFTFRRYDGDFWRHANPFTLAQDDRMSCYFMYPTADV